MTIELKTMTSAQVNDLRQLHTGAFFWGDIYTGTKAQLNAAGFGIGCAFPGEPNAAKKRCELPVIHGYKRVDVRIDRMLRFESGIPFEELTFDVWAHHLATDAETREEPIQFAPGVVFREELRSDTYTGTAQALIQSGVIEEHQLPGMPGCGKCTTTFDTDGKIFKRGSSDWCQPGFKVIRKYGKKISVNCIVTDMEHDVRRARYLQKHRAYELACLEAKRETQLRQSAPRPRPSLKLVWSA